jgi:hypothetical protein
VTPRTCTRRVACSTTAKQYSRVSMTGWFPAMVAN